MIPYGRQDITQDDIDAVVEVLRSDFLTQGPSIEKFERAFCDYTGARYAVAVSSCTAALHLSYLALNIQPGDRVWTSPNSFVATANAALYCGAQVDFIDIDPRTFNISVAALERKLIAAQKTNTLPILVVPVHFSGQSCDMQAIHTLSRKYGFEVIEDAAHASGGSYHGKPIGNCEFSAMACFSFHPVKIITSAEGGIITTNSAALHQSLLKLRTHGITKDPGQLNHKDMGPWYFEQQQLGYHYRMTDLQAALGTSQLKRLDAYVERRVHLANLYNEYLKDVELAPQVIHADCQPSWHLYTVRIDAAHRDAVFAHMRDAGILVNLHYIPIYKHPYYESMGFTPANYPQTELYYQETITLPLYPALEDAQVLYICETLKKALARV